MSILTDIRDRIKTYTTMKLKLERKELFHCINGDGFYPLKAWPSEMKRVFWKKPMGDQEAFKFILFGIGNGCSPDLICRWVMMSQCWDPSKIDKRARQLEFILNNMENKSHLWFYFDLNEQQLLYLCGKPRRKQVWTNSTKVQLCLKNITRVPFKERTLRRINIIVFTNEMVYNPSIWNILLQYINVLKR